METTKAGAGQASTGNGIAALCSFFIPGLGQILQGRLIRAFIQFMIASIYGFSSLGGSSNLWSILDAAMYKSNT